MTKSWDQVLAALTAAALCAPFIFLAILALRFGAPGSIGDILGSMLYAWMPGFFVASITGLITLPFYYALRRHRAVQWWHAGLAGGIVSGLLSALLGFDSGWISMFATTGLASGVIFRAVLGPDKRDQQQP